MIWDSMSSPRNYRETLQEGLCWKDCMNCTLKEQQRPFGSRKREESDVYCRKRKKESEGKGSVWSGHCQGEGLSPLEINQFEVFFYINVIQKTLHNFFQSNKSYPQLSGVFPTLFLVLLGFLSLLFLYWPCRQPPQRITHPRRSSVRHHSSIHGIIHNKPSGPQGWCRAPLPPLSTWAANKHADEGLALGWCENNKIFLCCCS